MRDLKCSENTQMKYVWMNINMNEYNCRERTHLIHKRNDAKGV